MRILGSRGEAALDRRLPGLVHRLHDVIGQVLPGRVVEEPAQETRLVDHARLGGDARAPVARMPDLGDHDRLVGEALLDAADIVDRLREVVGVRVFPVGQDVDGEKVD